MSKVSPAPVNQIERPFIDVIDRERPHDKYFLSSNAAQGILRRVRSQRRTLFPPLQASLARLAGEQQ